MGYVQQKQNLIPKKIQDKCKIDATHLDLKKWKGYK